MSAWKSRVYLVDLVRPRRLDGHPIAVNARAMTESKVKAERPRQMRSSSNACEDCQQCLHLELVPATLTETPH